MSTKSWLEISIRVDGEAAEAVSEVLNRYGQGGAVIERLLADGPGAHNSVSELTVKAYIPAGDLERKREIEEAVWHLGQLYPIPSPEFRTLTEVDWAEAWKAHYPVLRAGRRTVIVPQWLSYAPQAGEVIIILDPGMAFGTGTHPTTRLCLALLEETIEPGARVLDLGTGSGVLAISAAKQGASSVLAVDVDDIAVTSARKNAATNGVAHIVRVEMGSLGLAKGQYDLILVNILADVICTLLDEGLIEALKPGGKVIASGIIDDQEPVVKAAFIEKEIEIVGRRAERDWIALVGQPLPVGI